MVGRCVISSGLSRPTTIAEARRLAPDVRAEVLTRGGVEQHRRAQRSSTQVVLARLSMLYVPPRGHNLAGVAATKATPTGLPVSTCPVVVP
jgi:hypothetical protein